MFHVAAQTVSDMCTRSSQREAGMAPLARKAVLKPPPMENCGLDHDLGTMIVTCFYTCLLAIPASLWFKDEWTGL